MNTAKRRRDRVPDQGAKRRNAIARLLLMSTTVLCGVAAGLLFWWATVDFSNKGPGFLLAMGMMLAGASLTAFCLLIEPGVRRLLRTVQFLLSRAFKSLS